MLDDPVQALEVGGGMVDVVHVERILGQGDDGRALVHMDVLDAELFAKLEAAISVRIVQLPAALSPFHSAV